MYDRRVSGILLHPSALPGRGGIGDIGDSAYRFVDWLVTAKQRRWQIMPLGPTSYGDSPYAGLSALAGNPLLISLDQLAREGWLDESALHGAPGAYGDWIDYGAVIPWKLTRLERAFARFMAHADATQRMAFEQFCAEQQAWLDTFALFAALKEVYQGAPWNHWEPALVRRDPAALTAARQQLTDRVGFHQFLQWIFFTQWASLRRYANERGIQIIGDLPIFVAFDSADVWANPDIFYLDDTGHPTVVAGVPPDYFSPTGQRWGNPLYRWDVLARRGYDWWIERFRMLFKLVDIARIDHFRGFAAYWEVPAQAETALSGRWVPGPGAALFEAVRAALGRLPIIAEDLGLITPDVDELRRHLGFPGMAVLQFAWGSDATSAYLPHNYTRDLVVYTGTHDNDTTVGWWSSLNEPARQRVRDYLGARDEHIAWDFIRAALMSVADTVIIPMQDVLGLGSWARLNLPGRAEGNWAWRMRPDQLNFDLAHHLAYLTALYGREPLPEKEPAQY
ncbi:4-alpha-glucanotransferase [Chloroflexus sp.]|uniref:4-alpha-glucanotransferase n=1 Tax=Chloroflexus sp. TaxID=1904827 RepID=UPI00261EFA0C|nr:4-alpha-glucanotransferase [uncultured Chloroflexus sp.]